MARLACLMGCTAPTVENMSRSHPGLLDVPEPHVVGCLLTLRQLLPHVDVAQLVGTTPDLLLRPDAMDKARNAVQVRLARPPTIGRLPQPRAGMNRAKVNQKRKGLTETQG